MRQWQEVDYLDRNHWVYDVPHTTLHNCGIFKMGEDCVQDFLQKRTNKFRVDFNN